MKQPTLLEIQRAACNECGVQWEEMQSFSRHKRVVMARRAFLYIARQRTIASYPDLARSMGKTSHGSVIGTHRAGLKMMDEPAFAELVGRIEKRLGVVKESGQ